LVDYWLNIENIEKYNMIYISWFVCCQRSLGHGCGEFVIPFTNVDFTEYVKENRLVDFVFNVWEENYSVKGNSKLYKRVKKLLSLKQLKTHP
jgi:hypothetical protein